MKIQELIERRLNTILLLGETVNLSLAVQVEALEGHKSLSDRLERLFSQLPESFRASGKNPRAVYHDWLTSQYFVTLIAEIEGTLSDVLLSCLREYPQKIAQNQLSLQTVLDAKDKTEIIDCAIRANLNKMMYQKANDYKKTVCDILSMDAELLDTYWPVFVEAKARRDIGLHNDWRRNETYDRKLNEVGLKTDTAQILIADDDYFLRCTSHFIEMLKAICLHCISKFGAKDASFSS